MTENDSFLSRLTTKQLYTFAAIGILILAAGAVCSFSSKDKLKSGGLTSEEETAQSSIYAVSKIVSMIGFFIALIPSVKILMNEVSKKEPGSKDPTAAGTNNKNNTENSNKKSNKNSNKNDDK